MASSQQTTVPSSPPLDGAPEVESHSSIALYGADLPQHVQAPMEDHPEMTNENDAQSVEESASKKRKVSSDADDVPEEEPQDSYELDAEKGKEPSSKETKAIKDDVGCSDDVQFDDVNGGVINICLLAGGNEIRVAKTTIAALADNSRTTMEALEAFVQGVVALANHPRTPENYYIRFESENDPGVRYTHLPVTPLEVASLTDRIIIEATSVEESASKKREVSNDAVAVPEEEPQDNYELDAEKGKEPSSKETKAIKDAVGCSDDVQLDDVNGDDLNIWVALAGGNEFRVAKTTRTALVEKHWTTREALEAFVQGVVALADDPRTPKNYHIRFESKNVPGERYTRLPVCPNDVASQTDRISIEAWIGATWKEELERLRQIYDTSDEDQDSQAGET